MAISNKRYKINKKMTVKIHNMPHREKGVAELSQLYYGPVVIYYIVYYYTKRAILARLLVNEGSAIYVVL